MATAAKKRKCEKIPEFHQPYTIEYLTLDQLFVDHEYQRPLTGYESVIVANFESDLVLPLCVSERKSKTSEKCYAVIDGQTRLEALRIIRYTGRVACIVYTGLNIWEEASLFEAFQMKRKNPSPYDRYKASLIARNAEIMSINEVVTSCEFAVTPRQCRESRTIQAIGALKAIHSMDTKIKGTIAGPDLLRSTLTLCGEAFASHNKTIDAHILQGVAKFLSNHPVWSYDPEKLAAKLSVVGHDGLRFRATSGEKKVALLGRHGRVVAHYETVLEVWNEGEKTKLRKRAV